MNVTAFSPRRFLKSSLSVKLRPLIALSCLPASAFTAEIDFYRDVYPFLKANCVSCHNKTTTKADLNMETPELMIKGGESGPSIVPGKSAESLIVAASRHLKDMEMPPPNNKSGAANLSASEIAILSQWIDQGAKSSTRQERTIVLRTISASIAPIYCVAVSKDGRYAACGRSNRIFVYDLATRQLVAQVGDPAEKNGAAHRALVQSLSFSPDGTRLASGSFREVKLWKLDPAKPSANTAKAPLSAASADVLKKIATTGKVAVLNSTLSADGKQIITGCADGSVRVWDAASAKQIIELRGTLADEKNAAELERTVAAKTLEQAYQRSVITRLEAQDKALDVLLGKAKDAITTMSKVLPEKQKAVAPATTAKTTAQNAVDAAAAKLAASKDAAVEKELKAAQDKLITAKMTEVSALAAVSAAQSNIKDAEADMKRISNDKARNAKDIAAAQAAITAAKTAQTTATAALTALKQARTKTTAKPVAVALSPDGARAAALFDQGILRVWSTVTGVVIDEASSSPATTAATLTADADGSFTTGQTHTQSMPRWKLERTLGQNGLFADRVNAVRFSPDGKTLATGGGELSRSGDVILFDAASGKVTQTWKEKHSDTVLCLDFSPDGRLLASGAADKIARVTDIASGKQVNLFEGHTHHVTGVAFRSDGRVLATAGADGVVSTWDMILGERKKKIEGWTKEVTSLQFIGATNQIITSSGDNKVRVVTDDGGVVRNITGIPDYLQAGASTPDGGTLIAGGEDSILRVWDGAGKELATFGAK